MMKLISSPTFFSIYLSWLIAFFSLTFYPDIIKVALVGVIKKLVKCESDLIMRGSVALNDHGSDLHSLHLKYLLLI